MLRFYLSQKYTKEEHSPPTNKFVGIRANDLMKKWIILILTILLMLPLAYSLIDCEGVMVKGDLPCIIFGSWIPENACNTYEAVLFNEVPSLLDSRSLGTYGTTGLCNTTFGVNTNETELGSYFINFTYGDTMRVIIEEDNNMLIALVIGVSIIVGLFIFLTFAVKDDKPFLANFFFLGIFIFTTVLSNLIWKITNVNSAPYEPIMFIVYQIMLIITMLMMFIVLVMLTIEVVQIRRWKGNPVDTYRDNLGKNE